MSKTIAWFKSHPWLIALLQFSLIALAFALLVQSLVQNWNVLSNYPWSIRPGQALLAQILLVAGMSLLPAAYRRILAGFGYPFGYLQVFEGFLSPT